MQIKKLNSVEILSFNANNEEKKQHNENDDKDYDEKEHKLKWKMLSNMKYARYNASSILFENEGQDNIMVMGGWNGEDALLSCELFNIRNNKWTTIKNMNVKRNGHGSTYWYENEGSIIVVGGYNDQSHFSVEQYDFHKNEWKQLPNTNNTHRHYPCVSIQHDSFIKSNSCVIFVVGDNTRPTDAPL